MKIKKLIAASILTATIQNAAIATDTVIQTNATITNPQVVLDIVQTPDFGELKAPDGVSSICKLYADSDVYNCDLISGSPQAGKVIITGIPDASIQIYGTTDTSNGVTYTPYYAQLSTDGEGDEVLSHSLNGLGSTTIYVAGRLTFDNADIVSGTPLSFNSTMTVVYN